MSEPWFGSILKNHLEADEILDAVKADPFLRLERGDVNGGDGPGDWLVFLDPPEGYRNAEGSQSKETIEASIDLAEQFGEHPYFSGRMGAPHFYWTNPPPPKVVGRLESLRTWRKLPWPRCGLRSETERDQGPPDWGLDNIYYVTFQCGFDPRKSGSEK